VIFKKILRNACRCLHCGDEIESKHVHDFVQCKCGKIFTDGGKEYIRRGGDLDAIEDISEQEEFTTISFDTGVMTVRVKAKTDDEKVLDKLAEKAEAIRLREISGTFHHLAELREAFPDVEIEEAITVIHTRVIT